MDADFPFLPNLAGALLVAHPGLMDPNFRRSVILISNYSAETGSLGVVINKPLNCMLGELNEHFKESPLAKIKLYRGGPIGVDQVILTAWQWLREEKVFKLHFGIPEDKAIDLMQKEPAVDIRAFVGYSGWSDGQLEVELEEHAWLISSISGLNLPTDEKHPLWREIISHIHPELLFLADAPDNPSVN